jgi:hypothetical protein
MAKRVSIAVYVTLGAAYIVGAGCSSIPDSRLVRDNPREGGVSGSGSGVDGGVGGSAGSVIGGGGSAGVTASGGSGPSAGGNGAGGKGAGGTAGKGAGGAGTGGGAVYIDGGADGGIVGIPCGSNVCPDIVVGRTTYTACCAGTKGDRCGVDISASVTQGSGCVEPRQAGLLDPDICTDERFPDTPDGSPSLPGCCRPDSKSGVKYELPGGPNFGCVNPQDLGFAAGHDCTPAVCKDPGAACKLNSDCCSGAAGDPVCAQFANSAGAICSQYCVTNGDCASGCCILLVSGSGACAPDASSCSAVCRDKDKTCDTDTDCCAGLVCAPNVDMGPRICRPKCTTDATCSPEFCVKDEAGRGACTTSSGGLCTDSCHYAKDGSCDDGGPKSDTSNCALGTDCTDCKTARTGGTSLCFDSCATHGNGKCEDGGTGSLAKTCEFGSDCTDCKPRLGICSNDCFYANDGSCDDGGPGAPYAGCALGTDCGDCGVRVGGRGQGACDGTLGNDCVPHGGVRKNEIGNGTCECVDCAWDVADCTPPPADKCNGVALGACCGHNNACKLQSDFRCTCGGWCDWETPDCGSAFPTHYCDGWDNTDCDITMPNAALKGNNKCDCFGACSWEAADCAGLKLLCSDTCKNKQDGTCDDDDVTCGYGTDCYDCGPRFPKN